MTARKVVVLDCDWPDCPQRKDTWASKVDRARQRSAENGWSHVEGMDFCGPPDPDRDYPDRDYYQYPKAPEDHARLVREGEHQPQFRRETTTFASGHVGRYLIPSCACGWAGRSADAREWAVRQWVGHLRETLEEGVSA